MINILPLVTLPAATLTEKSKDLPVDRIRDNDIQGLIDNMIATMYEADGVGIAAPQVGRNIQLAIITQHGQAITIINPRFISKSIRQEAADEGCLSVPGFYGLVKRSMRVAISAYDRYANSYQFKAEGLTARIIQHEMDHLNGVLFIKRAKKIYSIAKK